MKKLIIELLLMSLIASRCAIHKKGMKGVAEIIDVRKTGASA
jgi:hypothetical protein